MIVLDLRINNELEVAHIRAIRQGEEETPKDGEICEYKLDYHEEYIATVHSEFGNPHKLATKMLEVCFEKKEYIEHLQLVLKTRQMLLVAKLVDDKLIEPRGLNNDKR